MCEQCLTDAAVIANTVLPRINLMQAHKGIESWPKDWYGLVVTNDPILVFEGPLVVNELADLDESVWDAITVEQETAYENFNQAAMRLGKALQSLPAMDGYFLVKSCMDAGYQPDTDGYSIEYWLMNHLATTTQK